MKHIIVFKVRPAGFWSWITQLFCDTWYAKFETDKNSAQLESQIMELLEAL